MNRHTLRQDIAEAIAEHEPDMSPLEILEVLTGIRHELGYVYYSALRAELEKERMK